MTRTTAIDPAARTLHRASDGLALLNSTRLR